MSRGNFSKIYQKLQSNWLYNLLRKAREGINKGGLVTLIKVSINYTEIKVKDGIDCILTRIKS